MKKVQLLEKRREKNAFILRGVKFWVLSYPKPKTQNAINNQDFDLSQETTSLFQLVE